MFKRIFLALVFIAAAQFTSYSQGIWTSKDGSIRNVNAISIFVSDSNVYLATRNELYVSSVDDSKWDSLFYIPAVDNEIRCVNMSGGSIYVGTKNGLFVSDDRGKSWRTAFKTIMPLKSSVTAVEVLHGDTDTILLCTEAGLFTSDNDGSSWTDVSGSLKGTRVNCVARAPGCIFIGADTGLFASSDKSYGWHRVIVHSNSGFDDKSGAEESVDMAESEESVDKGVTCVSAKGNRVLASVASGVFFSDDLGRVWKRMTVSGLAGRITYILPSILSERIYAATDKGVFEYLPEKEVWMEIYKGKGRSSRVNSIAFTGGDEKALWAATDKGVYGIELAGPADLMYGMVENRETPMSISFEEEPSLKDLQDAAIRYNDVSPEKIRKWHAESRMRSLVPKVTVGFDNSKSNTYEIYTSATRDYIATGPDDISEGFDVSVSWDLANLVWSDDQTNIDVRSRLTTQLRNDVLDDLRRAYFERKRLQYELMTTSPGETKLRFEKELRIAELTQAIDDLTGNCLTGPGEPVKR